MKEYWNVKRVYGNVEMVFNTKAEALDYADRMAKTFKDYIEGSPTSDYYRIIKQ
jgi:hypothetical protein